MNKMPDSKIPVLVTGIGGGGFGEQIFKALKLSDIPYYIFGADITPYSAGLVAVDKPYVVPKATDPEYINTLLKICSQNEIRAVFLGSEPELKVVSSNRDRFLGKDIFLPINPQQVINLCMDKILSSKKLKELGFNVPDFLPVRRQEDVNGFIDFPAVIKPARGSGSSANTYIIQDREELIFATHHLLSIYDEVILQSYVGTPEQEYTVGVLLDMEGNIINSIALRRNILSALSNRIKIANRTDNETLGSLLAISSGVSQGYIGRFLEITTKCETIAKEIGACSSINIQCRLVDDELYVFEINPRFSGTTSLRAMVGYNEPDVLLRKYLLGESIKPHFDYKEGTIVRSLSETFIDDSFKI